MFTGELAESRQTEVVIRDIDERAMELLIDFAYTSQVPSNSVLLIFGIRDWWCVVCCYIKAHKMACDTIDWNAYGYMHHKNADDYLEIAKNQVGAN